MKTKLILSALLLATMAFGQKKAIRPFELPEQATAFIEKNFPDAAIHHCWKKTNGNETSFKVQLASDTEIDFAEDGSWTEVGGKGSPVRSGFLSPAIIDYIKNTYPGQRVTNAEKDSKKIEVILTDQTKLEFDLNGKFLKIGK